MLNRHVSEKYIQEFKKYKGCLKHLAFDQSKSKGRRHPIEEDEDYVYSTVMDPFALDIKKLALSKAIRRCIDKMQVIHLKGNSHIRTRFTHTIEVVDPAINIAIITGLNEHLCQASATGHDVGHTPYGHLGEMFLNEVINDPKKRFRHNVFSCIVCQHLERKGKGLNLCFEVLQGEVLHSRGGNDLIISRNVPQEHNVVMYADKIGYTFADINDLVRFGTFKESDFPKELQSLGANQRERILSCILAIVKESAEKGYISFKESEVAEMFEIIRKFMYQNVYKQIDHKWDRTALERTYEYIQKVPHFDGIDPVIVLALMTDTEVDIVGQQRYLNNPYLLEGTGIWEIVKYFRNIEIPWWTPDLDWAK